jgi:chromosome segregation ATPase
VSLQHPRILMVVLDDLVDELRRWQITTTDTLADMSWHQRQGEEKVSQTWHYAGIILNQLEQDRQAVEDAIAEVNQLLTDCDRALQIAQKSLNQAEASERHARSTLSHWQGELNAALDWLARARARLKLALIELDAARNNLYQAEFDLSSARSALSRCESSGYTDSNGNYHHPNCSSQRAAVSQAENAVAQAKTRLYEAEQEVNAARDEVARAQARVDCCTNAVNYSQRAVSEAIKAVDYGEDAVNAAERSLENARAARRATLSAETEVIAEQEAAESMVVKVRNAEKLTEEANRDFQHASHTADSARRLVTMVSQELADRIENLAELNRPIPF